MIWPADRKSGVAQRRPQRASAGVTVSISVGKPRIYLQTASGLYAYGWLARAYPVGTTRKWTADRTLNVLLARRRLFHGTVSLLFCINFPLHIFFTSIHSEINRVILTNNLTSVYSSSSFGFAEKPLKIFYSYSFIFFFASFYLCFEFGTGHCSLPDLARLILSFIKRERSMCGGEILENRRNLINCCLLWRF